VALEEVAAARGVRRPALASRLGRVLRDSVSWANLVASASGPDKV
jgi:hypothetical protein